MTLLRAILLIFIIIGRIHALAQDVTGRVINHKTNEPIAYANIGILHTPYGTISDPDGSFVLRIPAHHRNDSIIFSALGFRRVTVIGSEFTHQPKIIRLEETTTRLNEVIVTDRPAKAFRLGNDKMNGGVLETDTAYAGGSVSLLIVPSDDDHKKGFAYPAYIEKASLRIMKNNLPEMKFRVRLNTVSADGTPGTDLLRESLVVKSDMRKGWLDFDRSSTGITFTEPFFVTFEQILDRADRTAIAKGFHDFMIKHPDKLRTDTVIVDGRKETRQTLGAIALDLPGTFVSISRKQKVASQEVSYQRDTSFSEWVRVSGIVTAVVILRPVNR